MLIEFEQVVSTIAVAHLNILQYEFHSLFMEGDFSQTIQARSKSICFLIDEN